MPVRTLIVDDSASMRAALRRLLSDDPEIEVVGTAPGPHSAREMIKQLDPDVLTLDVEMPEMDGIDFLEKIMRLRPMPVVMCSTLTRRGADATIEALRLGAVDFVEKPQGALASLDAHGEELRRKVRAAATSHVRRTERPDALTGTAAAAGMGRIIAIGASTGGVETLFDLLGALPADMPPIVVVQHMGAAFTASFADRLDRHCKLTVVEAEDGAPLCRGTVYIAPGDMHLRVRDHAQPVLQLRQDERVSGHRPSVDVLFQSMVPFGPRGLGIILTGMGADGAEGLAAMRQAGARTLGQSKGSCVVYGMPRAAAERGAVEKEVSIAAMPAELLRMLALKNGSE